MGLEGVTLVMAFEEEFGISISDEDASLMLTPRHVTDWICQKISAEADDEPCLSMVEFHRVRQEHFTRYGVPRRAVTLKSWMPNGWLCRRTVRQEVVGRVSIRATALMKRRKRDPRWKRSEVREAVRQIIRDQIGVEDFSDHDHFIRDLGID
jgi:acyl carrier protein